MNEIEKMYKNAEIEPRCSLWSRVLEIPATSVCEGICNNEELCSICTYGHVKHTYYPPFTAEKQIKLIKWILNSICLLNLGRLQFSDNFENDLAGLINELWLDMTNKEKKQIKEILE